MKKCAFCLQDFDPTTCTECPHCGMSNDQQPTTAAMSFRDITLHALRAHSWDVAGAGPDGSVELSCRSCGRVHHVPAGRGIAAELPHADGCSFAAALAWVERTA